ncbi:hypothetical protein [Streptomyces sp. NPDC059928]
MTSIARDTLARQRWLAEIAAALRLPLADVFDAAARAQARTIA